MYRYLFISLILVCFTASAGIYKWVDEEGNIHYSDKEEKGAEQLELPKAVTFTPQAPNVGTSSSSEPQDRIVYQKLSIVKPKMNETIRNNNGDVVVIMEILPQLRSGDSIKLYLDAKEVQKGSAQVSTTLSNLDRGSHTLKATIFDKNQVAQISSELVIFHLKREAEKSEDHTPKDNSEAYTPNFKQDESKKADYSKDYTKDYSNDYSKDYDSSDTYKDEAKKYKTGIPSKSGTFDAGKKTYSPNYNQKK